MTMTKLIGRLGFLVAILAPLSAFANSGGILLTDMIAQAECAVVGTIESFEINSDPNLLGFTDTPNLTITVQVNKTLRGKMPARFKTRTQDLPSIQSGARVLILVRTAQILPDTGDYGAFAGSGCLTAERLSRSGNHGQELLDAYIAATKAYRPPKSKEERIERWSNVLNSECWDPFIGLLRHPSEELRCRALAIMTQGSLSATVQAAARECLEDEKESVRNAAWGPLLYSRSLTSDDVDRHLPKVKASPLRQSLEDYASELKAEAALAKMSQDDKQRLRAQALEVYSEKLPWVAVRFQKTATGFQWTPTSTNLGEEGAQRLEVLVESLKIPDLLPPCKTFRVRLIPVGDDLRFQCRADR